MIVSGGFGSSGEQLARTALAQFADAGVEVRVVPHVRNAARVEEAVVEAQRLGATILHTLVDPALRRTLGDMARGRNVVAIDLIGRLLSHLSATLGRKPLGKPGLYRQLREDYFRRVEAIEFTLDHDDGRYPQELKEAQVVLVGPSRVGKTPLSIYLSTLGWKVANVPLVGGLDPPVELFEIDRRKVVGLTVEPVQLLAHRRRRSRGLGLRGRPKYTDAVSVADEVESALRTCRRGGFPVVDMTNRQIEEAADEILGLIR
jgi:[pyruvate, water dikinase]-phosphate phosphotransferase / [pyruvate, water dikinase] kinase